MNCAVLPLSLSLPFVLATGDGEGEGDGGGISNNASPLSTLRYTPSNILIASSLSLAFLASSSIFLRFISSNSLSRAFWSSAVGRNSVISAQTLQYRTHLRHASVDFAPRQAELWNQKLLG